MRNLNNISCIGVISDSHIPSRASSLPAVIHECFKDVDIIIHCGDLVSEEIVPELASIAPLIAVKGNMDPAEISLPDHEIIKIDAKFTICAAHGSGPPFNIIERLYKKFSGIKPDMILFGHTHQAYSGEYNGIKFFNPGSCTSGDGFNSIGKLIIGENDIKAEVISI